MPDRIIHKRSLTGSSVPTTASLEIGEFAINVVDAKVYLRRSGSVSDGVYSLVTANTVTTGSIQATSFTGSLFGTASWSNNAQTASYVNTLTQTVNISGALDLKPTKDPDPNGSNTTDTYLFVSASNTALGQDLYVRQDGNLVKWKWIEGSLQTGLLYGGVLTTGSASTVNISSGSGIIVNYNASVATELNPQISYVRWNSQSIDLTAYTASYQASYIYIDANGIAQSQQDTYFTAEQFAASIPLGMANHTGRNRITSVANNVNTAYNTTNQAFDFIEAFGPLKMNGLTVSGQTNTLHLNIGAGESYILGGFYQQDPTGISHKITSAYVTASIARVYRSGSSFITDNNNGTFYTTIDVTQYDQNGNGTLSAVGNNWSIQRVFFNPFTGRVHVYYGQNVYDKLSTAVSNLASDSFTEAVYSAHQYVFVAYLIVYGNVSNTDLTNTTDNKIVQSGLFRNTVGSSGTTVYINNLSSLSDVSITSPSNGQALVYSSGFWINGDPLNATNATNANFATNAGNATNATNADNININTPSPATYYLPLSLNTTSYNQLYVDSDFRYDTDTNTLITTYFQGDLVGNASTATTAGSATTANTANSAISASHADSADSANSATTAGSATNADNIYTGPTVLSGSYYVPIVDTSNIGYQQVRVGPISYDAGTNTLFVTASNASTASYVLNAISSSFASTASSVNILNQDVTITGSAFVSTSVFTPAIYGGSASGNNLILGSTTNATKGNITLGTSNYSELNNTLGLGAAANSVDRLYIQGIGNTSATDAIQAVNSNTNVLFKLQDNGQLFMGPVSSSTAMGTSNALLFISQSLVTGSTHTTAVYGTLVNQNIFSRANNNAASMFGALNQYTLQIDPSQTATGTTLIGKRDIINFSGSSPTSTTYILADMIFSGGGTTPIWRISAISSSLVATNNNTTTVFHQILVSQNLTANSLTNSGGGVVIGGGGNSMSMNVGPGIAIGTSNTITNTGGGTQFAIGLGNATLGNGVSGIGNYVYHSSTTSGVGAVVGVGSSTVGWGWGLGLVGSAGATTSAALQLRLNGNIVQYRNAIINNASFNQAQQLGFGSYSNMPTLLIGGILPAQQGGVNINATTGVALITGSIINTMTTVGNSFTEPGTAIIATTGSNADIRLNQNWTNATAAYIGTVFSSSINTVSGTGSLFIDWAPNTNAAQRIGTGGTPPTGGNYWIWIKPDEFRFSKASGVAALNIDTAGKIGIWPDVTSSYSATNELSAMLDINVGSVLNSNGQVSVSGSNIYPQIRLRGMSGNPSTTFTLDGSLWYLSTNSRLMIRQGSNTREIVTSSGSVGSSGSAVGSIDIVVNGTTYNVLYK